MNIVQAGPYPPPYGGMPIHVRQLHYHLKHLGHESIVINTWVHLTNDNHVIPLNRGRIRKHIHLMFKLIRCRCDLVHIHSTTHGSFWGKSISIWALRILHRKCILTMHGGDFPQFIAGNNQILKRLIRATLNAANSIIVVNSEQKKTMLALGLSDEKVFVVGPFLPMDIGEQEPIPTDVNYFLNSHTPVICCVGALKAEYGFELLITTFVRLKESYPKIGLVGLISVAGARDIKLEENLQLKIREHNLERDVLFCHNVPYALPIMQQTDVFVRPSYFDGDAISVREALSLGLPVVASNTDFRPEGVVLFQIGDEQDLYNKLMCILRTPQKYQNTKNYSGEKNLRDILDLYAACLRV